MQVTTQSSHFLHWAHPAHQGDMFLSVCIVHNTSGNTKENSPETLKSCLPSQAVAVTPFRFIIAKRDFKHSRKDSYNIFLLNMIILYFQVNSLLLPVISPSKNLQQNQGKQ